MRDEEALEASRAITSATQTNDMVDLPSRLRDFLNTHTEFAGAIETITIDNTRRSAGASSGTVLFDATTVADGRSEVRRLVFRYDMGGAFFSQYALPPQFEIMLALDARGLPVPKALWLDANGEVNGNTGLFMERIEGIAPSTMPFIEGPYMATGIAERRVMLLEAVRTLALFHATDPAGLADAHFTERGGQGHFLDREIAWTLLELRRAIPPRNMPDGKIAFYDEVLGTLESVARWLSDHAPRHREPELAHGDANISNFMYDARGRVIAVLDWELAHLGLGEADLAYQIAGIAHFALLAPPVKGIPEPEEMIAAYRRARGKLDDWEYARILGEWRLAVFSAMGMSRLPTELEHVELAYWRATRDRLTALLPELVQ